MRASVFLLLWTIAAATLLEKHSFVSPFNTVNAAGEREVGNWLSGGDTTVLQNFVRLTPDRQSKRGYLWNKASDGLGTDTFSMLFRFRISGQGKTLFGDGMALWFTEHSHFRPGQFHGFTEQFTGIGIVFDTFKNVEAGSNHRDVMIVVNDGTKNADALVSNPVGCDANIRYHEGRADFSVANSSVARITFDGRSLRVEIDARNSGTFVDCVTIDDLGLSSGWVRRSTLGVTATTGALADNHDVLSLRIYDRIDEANLQYQAPAPQPSDTEHLIHHWEHQLTAIHDSLSINIKKLRKQEEEAEGRIKMLEESIGNQVQTTLASRVQELEGLNLQKLKEAEAEAEARIARLEQSLNSQFHTHLEERLTKLEAAMNSQLHRTMEHRISTLENVVETKIDQRLARLEKAMSDMITTTVAEGVETSRRSWLIPFVVLVVACVGVFLFVWRKYVWLRKQHLI